MNPEDLKKIELLVREVLKESAQIDWWVYLIVFTVAVVSAYVVSYIKKSGEYLAINENIEKITQITEEVKEKFAANIALLTANLQVETKNRINLSEKQQEALESFYLDIVKLAYERILANSSQITTENAKGYQEFLSHALQDFKKTYISYHKVLLYLQHDSRIIDIVGPMFKRIQQVEKIFLIAFENLRRLLLGGNEYEIEKKFKEILRQFANDLDKASDDLSTAFTEYLGAVGNYYQSLRIQNTSSS
jgi:hypothetical protein